MTFDQFLRREGRGAKVKLMLATGVTYPTLRKMERREPVRLDAAWKVAVYLDCDPLLLANPKPRKKRAARAKRGRKAQV